MQTENSKSSNWAIIDYDDLKNGKDLKPEIEKGFGPKGHGIIFIKNIPGYSQLRKTTLGNINQLANLSEETLKQYQRPQIYHSLGWSHGVQKFQGKADTSKASYYYNPTSDQAYKVKPQEEKYFTQQEKKFYNSNKWVKQLPELQKNVKSLSKLMIEIGTFLAIHIDDYAHSKVKTYPQKLLYNIIKNGNSHFGRMLHYYPYKNKGQSEDNWCGWHNDHGALTALTSALYTDQNGKETDLKLKTGGLYAKNRFADKVRVPIPPQMLAFQLGQSMQIFSGGCLQATPHCVIQSDQLAGKNISRNTLAIFMQSGPLHVMNVPQGVDSKQLIEKEAYKVSPIRNRWQNGILFKQFHKNTLQAYS